MMSVTIKYIMLIVIILNVIMLNVVAPVLPSMAVSFLQEH